ncbi:MAG: biopolymer transporter ExbD [Pseudomonadales bacterium]|nr:biopolymer transporter ExbD [Pseudomonadales bacterium]
MKLKFLRHSSEREMAVSMTPLIDVVFLLMVFFLMTINFEKPEEVLAHRLPQLGNEASDDPSKDWEKVELKLEIIRESGQLKLQLQERTLENYDDLLGYLTELPEDITIIIEAADDVPYKHIIGVYNSCLKANKTDIVFSFSSLAQSANH